VHVGRILHKKGAFGGAHYHKQTEQINYILKGKMRYLTKDLSKKGSKVKEVMQSHKSAIFEGVNILPHLAKKDFSFPGVFLLGESFNEIFERNKQDPRWGKTEKLQELEARLFFNCDRTKYKEEAEKYGYKTFTNSEAAEKELIHLLNF